MLMRMVSWRDIRDYLTLYLASSILARQQRTSLQRSPREHSSSKHARHSLEGIFRVCQLLQKSGHHMNHQDVSDIQPISHEGSHTHRSCLVAIAWLLRRISLTTP